MHQGPHPRQNRLINLLSADSFRTIEEHLEFTDLSFGAVLVEANTFIPYAHFLLDGIAAQIADGKPDNVQIGLVGREGMSAPCLLLGSMQTPDHSSMAVSGSSFRISAQALIGAVARCEPLRRLMLQYAQARDVAMAENAMSAGRFTVQQRTARLILMCADRIDGDLIPITQTLISSMLGVRRASVTDAVHILERHKMIRSTRGWVEVRDRSCLLQHAEGSYGAAELEYERLLVRDDAERMRRQSIG